MAMKGFRYCRTHFAALPLLAVVLLGGCDRYPRDVEGTLDRVRAHHVLKVGVFAASVRPATFERTQQFLDRVALVTGSKVQTRVGAMESMLAELERGSLDLAIGEIAKDSPWRPDIAVIEPLAVRRVGDRELALSAIARNGENRWIMLLERETRDLGETR